jgi:hypothetical protein
MTAELRTFGHATLVVTVDGSPLLATDPWLVGSTYWASWWLERYPDPDDIDLVRQSQFTYLTHSHPDHFHWSSLRMLGPRTTLHPMFPSYSLPAFLTQQGYPAYTLQPWQRYRLADRVTITSIPIPIDDSILLIESATTLVVNLNDGKPPAFVLRAIYRRFAANKDIVYVLSSYSPASIAASMYRDDTKIEMKSKAAYVRQAFAFADTLGATHYVPFASQAVFRRSDSSWANDLKVTFDDLASEWPDNGVRLCHPYTTIDLDEPAVSPRTLAPAAAGGPGGDAEAKVAEREAEEHKFILPADFDERLIAYLDGIRPLRFLYRRGIGWRLCTSGTERFYNSRTRTLEQRIPDEYDIIVTLPDQVLHEALQNDILTDLGITMIIRVDTRIDLRRTYGFFLLMGLRDYKHIGSIREFGKFVGFYAAMLLPGARSVTTKEEALPLPVH